MKRPGVSPVGVLAGGGGLLAGAALSGSALGPTFAAAIGGLAVGALVASPAGGRGRVPPVRPRPLSVAVAGDSGTGKDTLCHALAAAFGPSKTAFLMGDDYHHADRAGALWRLRTHLHPGANDLAQYKQDALALLSGRGVSRPHYDHGRGRYSAAQRTEPAPVVVLSGLHALTSRAIRDVVDLTVFTDMDEQLRRRMKMDRDVNGRGHAPQAVQQSLHRRAPDRHAFIVPQQQEADVVLRLEPAAAIPPDHEAAGEPLGLRVVVTLRDLSVGEKLGRALTSLTGQPARIRYLDEPGALTLTASADALNRRDIAALASHLLSGRTTSEHAPAWFAGSRGLMQLVVVSALLEKRALRPGLEVA